MIKENIKNGTIQGKYTGDNCNDTIIIQRKNLIVSNGYLYQINKELYIKEFGTSKVFKLNKKDIKDNIDIINNL